MERAREGAHPHVGRSWRDERAAWPGALEEVVAIEEAPQRKLGLLVGVLRMSRTDAGSGEPTGVRGKLSGEVRSTCRTEPSVGFQLGGVSFQARISGTHDAEFSSLEPGHSQTRISDSVRP
jgi:hypothetical protein